MKLRLVIRMDNAAFTECPGLEVARILRKLAARLEDVPLTLGDEFLLMDVNGNRVGLASVQDD